MSAAARRAAEMEMSRRDRADQRRGRGARAAKRSRAPAFLQDEDEDEDDVDPNGGLLAGMKKRTRKQYDERRDIDDAEGADDVGTFAPTATHGCSLAFHRMCHLSIWGISRLTLFQPGLQPTVFKGP
jgi:Mini-chromosome maintenance protein 2